MAAGKAHPQHWLEEDLAALAAAHPAVAKALKRVGPPEPRVPPRGFGTLAKIIVGQQVSTHAARAIGQRLTQSLGGRLGAGAVLTASDETLRGAGLSGQKVRYLRALAVAVETGALPLRRLPRMEDAAVVEAITSVLGFGVWSAQMYLLFSLGRRDVWPAGISPCAAALRACKDGRRAPQRGRCGTLPDPSPPVAALLRFCAGGSTAKPRSRRGPWHNDAFAGPEEGSPR